MEDFNSLREKIHDDFEKIFSMPKDQFSKLVFLVDKNIGFSTEKDLGYEERERMGIGSEHKYFSRIYLFSKSEEVNSSLCKNLGKIPITIAVNFLLKKIDEKTEYGAYDNSYVKKKNFLPFDFTVTDECEYDYKNKIFIFRGKKFEDPIKLLNKIYKLHISPSKRWSVIHYLFVLRKKHLDMRFLTIHLLNQFSKYLTGKKLKFKKLRDPFGEKKLKYFYSNKLTEFVKSTFEKEIENVDNLIEFYGFKVAPRVMFIYALSHLILIILLADRIIVIPDHLYILIVKIFKNNYTTILYSVVSISVFKWIFGSIDFTSYIEKLAVSYNDAIFKGPRLNFLLKFF